MTQACSPRWRVFYRPADDPKAAPAHIDTSADSLVTALKTAQMELFHLGGPWKITAIIEIEGSEA